MPGTQATPSTFTVTEGGQTTKHAIDTSRTVTHDLDRMGSYYDVWCVCGANIVMNAYEWGSEQERQSRPFQDLPPGSVMYHFERHMRSWAQHTEAVHKAEAAIRRTTPGPGGNETFVRQAALNVVRSLEETGLLKPPR
jgi:hypothetical protein